MKGVNVSAILAHVMISYGTGTEFNDIFVLDTSKIEWTELTSMIGGSAPLGRRFHGFTVCSGLLYIFGGYNINLGEHPSILKKLR